MHESSIHHRRSIRLHGYDYSQPGAYAVTICTYDKHPVLGEIVEGEVVLNDLGRMVRETWEQMPSHYPGCGLDAFVIMPNHMHGIIVISTVGAGPSARPGPSTRPIGLVPNGGIASHGAGTGACPYDEIGARPGPGVRPSPRGLSLPDLVQRFKSLTSTRHRHGVASHRWPDLGGKLWQRNYYEHIVRNDDELQKIRQYIVTNPLRAETDWENILGS